MPSSPASTPTGIAPLPTSVVHAIPPGSAALRRRRQHSFCRSHHLMRRNQRAWRPCRSDCRSVRSNTAGPRRHAGPIEPGTRPDAGSGATLSRHHFARCSNDDAKVTVWRKRPRSMRRMRLYAPNAPPSALSGQRQRGRRGRESLRGGRRPAPVLAGSSPARSRRRYRSPAWAPRAAVRADRPHR